MEGRNFKRTISRAFGANALAATALMAALAVAMTLGAPLQAQQPPEVRKVNDHWSAWDPPQTLPEGAQIHVIETGDTLWSLAGRFFGDPYLWPQLWEYNQYILDAMWIYPGDPLILPATPVNGPDGIAGPSLAESPAKGLPAEEDPYRGESETAGGPGSTTPPDFSTPPLPTAEAPVPLGFESDIYCSGFIGDPDEEFPYRVASSEYEFLTPTLDPSRDSAINGLWGKTDTQKYALSRGDIIYLDGGRADGLSAGKLLTAIQPRERINHPVTGRPLGRLYNYLARVRILSVQDDTAIAEIVSACDPVTVGTPLRPFEPEPVPLRRMTPLRPVNYPASADEIAAGPMIIAARDRVVTMGSGSLAFIDHGEDQEAVPGDVYTIYREGRRGFPPIVLGEAAVLSVHKQTSLVRILRSRYAVYVGDSMVLK